MTTQKTSASRALAKTALEPYVFGSNTAKRIEGFIFGTCCAQVSPASYEFEGGCLAGRIGAKRSRRGHLVFAVYPRGKRTLTVKCPDGTVVTRSPTYPPQYLTAPEIWALINGHFWRISREEIRHWRRSLEEALEFNAKGTRYTPPSVCNPDSTEDKAELSVEKCDLEQRLSKRLELAY